MPTSRPAAALVRPAAVVNGEIRELAGRIALSQAERDRLAALWAEYGAAVAAEAELAA